MSVNAFAGLPHISDLTPRNAADDTLFAELAAAMDRHGALDRFGIMLLHVHEPLDDGEVLLESSDEEKRGQTLTPVSDWPANAIETAWRLGTNGVVITYCICKRG